MNFEFLLIALIIGTVVDWLLQSKYQAMNKTKNLGALLEHSFTYSIFTGMFVGWILDISPGLVLGMIWAILFITHVIIDNRLFVKFLMYLKGYTWEECNNKEYAWLEVGIDQILHMIVILIIAAVL
jgi:hypothetical protein